MSKSERYQKISEEIVDAVGGMDNIAGSAHCATRLRIVLKDNDKADMEKLDNIDLCKGVFIAGDQLQMIFGAGLVNDVYDVFAKYTHTENMSLQDIKNEGAKKHNPLQLAIKSLSDVFIEIMPGILAAALLLGLTGVLNNLDVVKTMQPCMRSTVWSPSHPLESLMYSLWQSATLLSNATAANQFSVLSWVQSCFRPI